MAVETNARIEFSVSSVEEWEKVNPKLHQGEPVFAKKPSGKYILKVGAPGGSTYKNAVVVWDQDDAETKMENTQTAAAEAFASKSAAATSASNAKTSEANAANSAKAAKQSEENAKRWDPTQYVQSVAESNGKVTVTKGGGESTTFNAGLNILARNKAYAVGDIAYSPNLPSYLYLECTTEGTTGATEPDMSTISGVMVDDGTAKFSVKTVCAKEYVDSKSDNEAKKWKNAYNSLRKRSYPIEFDEDELTLLASDFPPNKSPLKLSQPYTGFDGLYLIYGESNSVTSEYISTKQIQERMNFGEVYWFLGNGVGSMFTRASVSGTTPTSIVLNFNNQTFWRVYGVKFKKIT